ncbi:23S rRNA (adenine(1618)-N(6))-methyltransferase RlmF [Alteromonas sp. D210916BOD_24]|uniref:23S rRNA (adenine(1618)-N(6))-methyltransferase RlmF n=1 Tax=Alteromonas sp. D210916BOD_24 TaxID=3157618 RepID=UPI00399C8EC4
MHPRNLHKNGYPMEALCETYPALKPFLNKAKSGKLSIDFSHAPAVKTLNAALLKHYYQVDFWQLPDGYLCPPVPGRADYIHGIADLLKSTSIDPSNSPVKGLDIGVGANAIYPIIGVNSYGWQFVGSDVDAGAIKNATEIALGNTHLKDHFSVRRQSQSTCIFKGIIRSDDVFTFSMCNPPFHKSAKDAVLGTQRKTANLGRNKAKRAGYKPTLAPTKANLNFSGQANELWCEGGELAFIQRMISESTQFKNNVNWFTCLVSKSAHLRPIETSVRYVNASDFQIVEMGQGSKLSRFVAWTFT